MNQEMIEKYVRLIVCSGINIQKDQTLVISAPIECASFTRQIAQVAYERGAKDVVVDWADELFTKTRYLYAPEAAFGEFPEWKKQFYMHYALNGAAFLTIDAHNPELMKDVNPATIGKETTARARALKEFAQRKMMGLNAWCVAAYPSKAWAKKVYPGVSGEEAVEALWRAIIKVSRIGENDPILSWEKHKEELRTKTDFLNVSDFKYLHYKNELGTDLRMELPENHIWIAGATRTPEGVEFSANIPTEEIFSLPVRTGVNGTVVSSKPLSYNGSIINKLSLTLKDGRIIDYQAEEGYEILKGIIETDEGSHYLGEVALVPYSSPISLLNTHFYNTLFDENASCHLAIGAAYPCIKNVKSEEDLVKYEINQSLKHVDFMIGTQDLEIVGTTKDGREVPVFVQGNFTDCGCAQA